MPTDSVQQVLTAFELCLLLAGLWLTGRMIFSPKFRARWGKTNQLPTWSVAPAEFAMYLFLLFAGGFILQSVLRLCFGAAIAKSGDRAGLEILVYGAGLDGGALIGWLLFPMLRRGWHADYGVSIPLDTRVSPPLSWSKVLLYGAGTLALAMPIVILLSLGWTFLLRYFGLPDEAQDAIGIFSNTKSYAVVAGMLVIACVLAPAMEELLFRAGLYRFCRQRLGRGPALIISGVVFGAIHLNWASFLPLSIFGVLLALVYEATGSIRVPIVAHAFFNLNSILFILSGLSQ